MAKTIVITDDLDGSAGARGVTFSIDGNDYEIDLSDSHIDELKAAFAPFIKVARKSAGARPVPKKNRAAELAEIREWAKANGHVVSDRGRIAADIVAAYNNR